MAETTTTRRIRNEDWNLTAVGRTGKVHAASQTDSPYSVIFCTGRSMRFLVPTHEGVTCAACLAAIEKECPDCTVKLNDVTGYARCHGAAGDGHKGA